MRDATVRSVAADADGEVLYSVEDRIARITINRPQRRNALTWTAIEAAGSEPLAAAKDDPQVRVVVLSGAGRRRLLLGSRPVGDGVGLVPRVPARRPGAGWRSCSASCGPSANP